MNEKQLKAFWLGFFIIAAIILISWFLLFIRPTYGDGRQIVIVRFSNIEKVSIGTKVTYAGEAVGKVAEIREVWNARELPSYGDNGYYFFELVLKIDSHVKIYDTDEIILSTNGLLGEKSISIVPQGKLKYPGQPISQDAILYAKSGQDLQNQLEQFTNSANQLSKNLNTFLINNQDQLAKTFISLEKATDRIEQFLTQSQDNQLPTRFAEAATELSQAMQATTLMLHQVQDKDLITNISNMTLNLSHITHEIHNRQGTLGKLIKDEELYLQIAATFSEFRCLVEDIRNYGLLFHYNKQWQRKQKCLLLTPCQ